MADDERRNIMVNLNHYWFSNRHAYHFRCHKLEQVHFVTSLQATFRHRKLSQSTNFYSIHICWVPPQINDKKCNCKRKVKIIFSFISECDIEYISPSNYKPPELQNKGTNGEVMDADDHYERLVRGSLKVIEKQKVN